MSCPACVDFPEQLILKASLAPSRHVFSFTVGRHSSGHQNALFSCKRRVMKVQRGQHPRVICLYSLFTHCHFTQSGGQAARHSASLEHLEMEPSQSLFQRTDSPAPIEKMISLGLPKVIQVSLVMIMK